MTVIRPNSVAGINSITVQSGNSLAVHKSDGSLIRTITANSGVSTFSSISVGTATTDNSAAKSINIGLGASISQHVDNSLSFGTAGTERVKITSSGNLEMPNDNDYIKIGAGGDLQFVHTGSASVINNGTGFLEIQSDGTTFELADGTEKARFDSSGRLLIGTVTEGHSNADDFTVATSGNTGITIRSGTSNGGNIFFSDATSGTGEYAGMISYDHNDNVMTFATSDGSERLRITSGGLVGINTNSPDRSLHVISTNGTVAHFQSTNANTISQIVFEGNNAATNPNLGATGEDFHFTTGNNERLRIDSDGAVNIGSSPAQATGTHTQNAILTAKGYPGDQTSAAILALVRGNNTTSTASGHTLGRIVFSDKQAGEYALIEGESEHAAAVGDTPGRLIFATTSDGATTPSEKVRIDMNGDLIVHGTSLNNSAVAGQALQINGTTRPTLILRGNADSNQVGEIQFADNSGSDDQNTGIRAGLIKYDHSNNAMTFRVAGTYQGLKISGTNGRLERTFGGGSGSGSDLDGMWFNNDQAASGTFVRFWQTSGSYGANQIGSISHSANNTAYNTSSDYRLKENINAITDAITRLKTLKPSRFNFKTEPSVTVDGFIAHEVTAVPEAITGTKDEVDSNGDPLYQGIDQSKLVPLLTAALQEAVTKIETLETKVAALEGG